MIVLTCECGEIFRADETHIGRSIRCTRCERIITVARKSEPSIVVSRPPPTIDIPPKPVHAWWPKDPLKRPHFILRNRLIPLLGIAALAVGVILTIVNLRGRKGDKTTSQLQQSPAHPHQLPVLAFQVLSVQFPVLHRNHSHPRLNLPGMRDPNKLRRAPIRFFLLTKPTPRVRRPRKHLKPFATRRERI
jgi:hypothetical protein